MLLKKKNIIKYEEERLYYINETKYKETNKSRILLFFVMKLSCFKNWLMVAMFLPSLDERLVVVRTALPNITINSHAVKYKTPINVSLIPVYTTPVNLTS